jgi:hypothetical protein
MRCFLYRYYSGKYQWYADTYSYPGLQTYFSIEWLGYNEIELVLLVSGYLCPPTSSLDAFPAFRLSMDLRLLAILFLLNIWDVQLFDFSTFRLFDTVVSRWLDDGSVSFLFSVERGKTGQHPNVSGWDWKVRWRWRLKHWGTDDGIGLKSRRNCKRSGSRLRIFSRNWRNCVYCTNFWTTL